MKKLPLGIQTFRKLSEVQAEILTDKSRIDMVMDLGKRVYVIPDFDN